MSRCTVISRKSESNLAREEILRKRFLTEDDVKLLDIDENADELFILRPMLPREVEQPKESEMDVHIQNMAVPWNYWCPQCDFETIFITNMKHHITTHMGDDRSRYVCHICEFKSLFKSTMDQHMDTHFGSKRYYCKNCSYRTRQKQYFLYHMKRHC